MSDEFELAVLRTEYANAIKSLTAISEATAKQQHRAEVAEAALARVSALADEYDHAGRPVLASVSTDLHTAMEPTP